jgi:hypothetical protein
VVKPDRGNAIIWLELKENIGSSNAGAYKNIRYVTANTLRNLLERLILVPP